MKRRFGLFLVILVVSTAAAAAATTTVSFMTWDSGKGFEITQAAVDAFQKKFPGVKVELQSVPQGFDEKVMTAHAAGNTPDGLLMWNTSQFAEAGVVASLTPYITRDTYDMGKFLPVLKAWTEYRGQVWGLPKDWTPRVIWYNRKVFDEAKVPYPVDGWTWSDFTATAKKLTNGKSGRDARFGYVAIPGHTYAIQQYIWSNGGDLVSPDGRTASGYINSTKVVEVVRWYKGLYDMSITTGAQDQYQNLGQTEFQSGIVGMMDNGVWPLATFKDDTSLSFDVVSPPVPRAGAALKPIIHSSTWSIFAKSKNKDATWQLIKFLADPEGLRLLTASFWAIPGIPVIAEELGFNRDPILKKLIAVGSKPTIAPVFVRSAQWFEADNEFMVALQKIFISGADIPSTLNEAAARMDRILQGSR